MSFIQYLLENRVKIKVEDSAFEGKSDPTQYDKETNTILIKSSMKNKIKSDPEGWMVHEYKHAELRNIKDDGKEYPTNNIEREAYKAQFKYLKGKGFKFEDLFDNNKFPTLSLKLTKYNGEYEPILRKYWELINGKEVK